MKLARPVRLGAAGAATAALLLGSPALAGTELISDPRIGSTTVTKAGEAMIEVTVPCGEAGLGVHLTVDVKQKLSKRVDVEGHGYDSATCRQVGGSAQAKTVVRVVPSKGSKGKSAWPAPFGVGRAEIRVEAFACHVDGWGSCVDDGDDADARAERKLSHSPRQDDGTGRPARRSASS